MAADVDVAVNAVWLGVCIGVVVAEEPPSNCFPTSSRRELDVYAASQRLALTLTCNSELKSADPRRERYILVLSRFLKS